MLKETVEYLEEQKKQDTTYTYEIILVDDGSRDNTIQVALDYAKTVPDVDLRILALDKNRGKGGAVTQVSILYGCPCKREALFNSGISVLGHVGFSW